MKIGIVTFWWGVDNYGQQLQIYALQEFLRNNGHDVFLLEFIPTETIDLKNKIKKITNIGSTFALIKKIRKQISIKKINKINVSNPRFFKEFRREKVDSYIYTGNYEQLSNNPPAADAYIVGSDQVWNPNYVYNRFSVNHEFTKTYFLDFLPDNIARIAYAASWGKEELPNFYKKYIAPMLKKFVYVSVREKSGVKIYEECVNDSDKSNYHASWACDPTLLLNKEHYIDLYSSYQKRNGDQEKKLYVEDHSQEKYLLLYYLNNGGNCDLRKIYAFAQKKGLRVKYITANGMMDKNEKLYPSIPQWLELIHHATYVVTNSYHGCVFSIIFQKQFAAIQLTGANKGMNERLVSLFEICSISPRMIDLTSNKDGFSALDVIYTPKINRDGGVELLKQISLIRI